MAYNYKAAKAAGLTDEQIQQYLSTKQGEKQQSKQGGGLVDWLPAIGAIGGSFIPGAGTIAGGALGAGAGALLKQSMVGGGPEDIVKEAALGGAGGVLGKGIGAIAGKVLPKAATQVAGQTVAKSATGIGEKFAAKTIASNFTIPPKLAPQLQLEDSLGQMIKDGIKIPNSIAGYKRTSQQIIDITTNAQRMATKDLKIPISYDEPLTIAKESMSRMGALTPDERLDTLATMRNYFNNRVYPAPGHIGADDALEIANSLDEEGFNLLNKGLNELSPNVALEEKGNAFIAVAEDLRSQIHRGFDSTGIFKKVQTDAVEKLAKISPDLAQRARLATNMGQLRSVAGPYVRISRGAQSTINRQQTPFVGGATGLGNRVTGAAGGFALGGLPGAVAGAALAPAAAGLAQAAQPAITGLAAKGMIGAGKLAGKIPRPGALATTTAGQAGVRVGQGKLPEPAGIQEELPTETTSQQPDDNKVRAAFAMAILQNPKQASAIKSAYDLLSGGDKSQDQQKSIQNIQEARNLVKTFAGEVKNLGASDFGPVARTTGATRKLLGTLGLDPDVRSFTQVRKAMRVKMARAMSEVGNLTEQEQEVALNLIPDIGDSTKEISEKVRLVEQILSGAEQRSRSTKSSLPLPRGEGFLEGFSGGL